MKLKVGNVYENMVTKEIIRLDINYSYRATSWVRHFGEDEDDWTNKCQEYTWEFLITYCKFKYIDYEYLESIKPFEPHYFNRLAVI